MNPTFLQSSEHRSALAPSSQAGPGLWVVLSREEGRGIYIYVCMYVCMYVYLSICIYGVSGLGFRVWGLLTGG